MTRISAITKRLLSALPHRMRSPMVLGVALAVATAIAVAAVIGGKALLPRLGSIPEFSSAHFRLFSHNRPMCAELTDAVGLYPGNKVMLLGIEVGSVTAVTNKPDHVRVDFTVARDLDLPADVGAVTYSQSIVTDRHLELTKPYASGPRFTGNHCITIDSTKTPIGISETFNAVGKLSDTVLAATPGQNPSEAPGVQAINDSLRAASRSLDGTGPDIAQTLRDLVTMLADPYKADADYRELFANSEILSSDFLTHWDSFASVLRTLPATTNLITGLSGNFAAALDHLNHLLPILVEAVTRYAPRVYENVSGKLIPYIRDLLNAYTPLILSFVSTLPPLFNLYADTYEPTKGTHNITYIPPHVAISPTQASAICANLTQRKVPGSGAACAPGTTSDPVTLGLTDLILGAALSP